MPVRELGAMLVPLNWRLAVPEQVFILRDAEVKALFVEAALDAVCAPLADVLPETRIVGLDYAPEPGNDLATLIDIGSGDGREPHVDWHAQLLIVYTAGTTGRPKGAVLTQEALLWNGVMSQHMHAMTSDDHVLTVLPFFHVGGMNIQTTPALHLGATITIHPRFTADDTLHAIAQERPTLTVLVPATIQALIQHPRWQDTDLSSLRAISTGSTLVPQSLVDAITTRGVPVLQVYGATETSPIAVYTRLGGDLSRGNSTGLPGLVCEARVVDENGRDMPPGVPGEAVVRGPNVLTKYLGQRGGDSGRVARRLVLDRRHRGARRRWVFHDSGPQEEHDRVGRREHLSGGDRTRSAGASGCLGSRCDRRPRSKMAGGPACHRGASPWSSRYAGRIARVLAAAACTLQGAPRHPVRS